jgi:hypothetical protein
MFSEEEQMFFAECRASAQYAGIFLQKASVRPKRTGKSGVLR